MSNIGLLTFLLLAAIYCKTNPSIKFRLPGRKSIFIRESSKQITLLSTTNPTSYYTENVWWKDGLTFGCTGCGRCCQNEGEVWFDTDEFFELCQVLKMPFNDVLEKYSESVIGGWIKMKSKDEFDTACIFLAEDGKTCNVYESRPVQCRSYPYWPNLLVSRSTWDAEAVVPENQLGKHWTRENGGCEGFNNEINGTLVPPTKIAQNYELYKKYTEQFPLTTRFPSPTDRNRLLVKLDVIQGVKRSIKEWIYLYGHNFQCLPFNKYFPFAASESLTISASPPLSLFQSSKDLTISFNSFLTNLRYRVYFGSTSGTSSTNFNAFGSNSNNEINQIINKINYEKLVLLTENSDNSGTSNQNSRISATVLILPFAFQDYDEFERFQNEWRWQQAKTKASVKQSKSNIRSNSESSTTKSSPLLKRMLQKKKQQQIQQLTDVDNSAHTNEDEMNMKEVDALYNEIDDEFEITFYHPQFMYSKAELNYDDKDKEEDDDDDEQTLASLQTAKQGYNNQNENKNEDDEEEEEENEEEEEVEDEYAYDPRHFMRRSPFPTVLISRKKDIATYTSLSSVAATATATTTTIISQQATGTSFEEWKKQSYNCLMDKGYEELSSELEKLLRMSLSL